jgi:hypothetical protein
MRISILKVAAPIALASALALGVTVANAQGRHGGGGGGGGPHFSGGSFRGGPSMGGPRFNRQGNFQGSFNPGPRQNFVNRSFNRNFSTNMNNRRYAGAWNGNRPSGDWRWRRRGWWGPGFVAGLGLGYGGYYGFDDYPYAYAYDDGPYDYYGDVYADTAVGGDDPSSIAYCQQRYKSYDVRTQSFLGYDGQRHPCP